MRSTAFTAMLALLDWNTSTVSSTEQQAGSPSTTEPAVSSPAQQQTREPSTSEPGVMFWTDGKAKTMPVFYRAMAMVTLLFFVSWIWIIAFMILATPFSKLVATVTVLAWLTLLLPTQVRSIPCDPPPHQPVCVDAVFQYNGYMWCVDRELLILSC
jgi:hypothetical protein